MDLTFIGGDNFSGRSSRLREWAGIPADPGSSRRHGAFVYIPPDASEAFSGLTPTVRAEFELSMADEASFAGAVDAMEQLGFGRVLDQNPFTLSGGEQVVAAVVAALAGRPSHLAIDGAFEQLAPSTRDELLGYLATLEGSALISDNRVAEWRSGDFEAPRALGDPPLLWPDELVSRSAAGAEIELVDLSFSYPRGRKVFDRFNLKLDAGRAYLLKGPNGSGKTTLSKLLAGLLRPSSGEIRVNGSVARPWKTPGRDASYHFQNPAYQLFSRTIEEELAHAQDLHASARGFGLAPALDTHPLDLPYVLRKRLAVAAAVLRAPDFLILDEPTLGQDRRAAAAISTIVAKRGGLRITHAKTFDDLSCVHL